MNLKTLTHKHKNALYLVDESEREKEKHIFYFNSYTNLFNVKMIIIVFVEVISYIEYYLNYECSTVESLSILTRR